MKFIIKNSPNFSKKSRKSTKIKFVIIHYTGMQSKRASIDRLTSPKHKVSCHYLVCRRGEIIQMVGDKKIAWHAGKSKWKNHNNLNENSIGGGGINGDLTWMLDNFELFKTNSLFEAILHKEFFGNRTPLLYVINILFNPFVNDLYLYRLSIFLFSLMGPFFFYLCLKEKYKKN